MSMRRSPIEWPNGARLAFTVEVSFEAFPEHFGTPGSTHPSYRHAIRKESAFAKDLMSITDRQFGERVGIFRLLDILNQATGIKATFSTSGAIIETFPETIKEIIEAGHEMACWKQCGLSSRELDAALFPCVVGGIGHGKERYHEHQTPTSGHCYAGVASGRL